MNDNLVDIRRVNKAYKRGRETIHILTNLSLTVPKGDFLAIMGPSGSGKTTLLNLIGGLDVPDTGSIAVNGQRIDQLSSRQLTRWRAHHVGFISQFYNLLPMLSAEANVTLPLLLTNLNRAARKKHANTALQIVGLAERAKHKPNELSGGEQQRVAIARALVSDPDLLICDEPTGDLDRQTANNILALLKELNEDYGKSIIMVTHDAAAAQFARRTINLDKGLPQEQGAVA